jgi:hypothetical protein
MAISIPDALPRHRFRHRAEFEVYEALLEGLRDDWVLIPSLEARLDGTFAEREMDIVLLHSSHGIVLVEVKSFPMRIDGGRFFYEDGGEVDKDPMAQVAAQRQHLTSLLSPIDPHVFSKIRVAIATPSTIAVEGALPPALRAEQLLDAAKLADPEGAILDLVFSDTHSVPLGEEAFARIISCLAPSATLDTSPAGIRAVARARMERRLEIETRVLETLDENRRVLVTGGAGSGKTRLALAWARRAAGRGERVLVTCYNDPLGHAIAEELVSMEDVVAAPFLRYLAAAPGPPPLGEQGPVEDPRDYWRRVEHHAMEHVSSIEDSFDTIVVDEVQDFSPLWLALLEELLDPDGPQRIMLVGDPGQSIRRTGMPMVGERPGWVRAELLRNNRNAPAIAALLRSKLGGAPSPNAEPFASPIVRREADDDDAIVDAVAEALSTNEDEQTWVLATSSHLRDLLRHRLGLVSWEGRHDGTVGETVHRVKGLEVERVVLVVADEVDVERCRQLLYAGASRALESLEVVGSARVLALL